MHHSSSPVNDATSPAQGSILYVIGISLVAALGGYLFGFDIFHLDGKGMLRHLDRLLEIPEIAAIQWVHGVGDDAPIMQWLPVIRKIQAAGKGVIVDLQPHELEGFIAEMKPQGLYLCLAADEKDQPVILKRLEKW
jgi:hypothetical protein